MKLKKILYLSLILTGSNGIAYGQFLTPLNDTVIYTAKQDIKCLICLVNEDKKDSLISSQKREIKYFESLQKLDGKKNRKQKLKNKINIIGSNILTGLVIYFVAKK